MREHLATLVDDFHRHGQSIAIVRHQGNRRRVTTYSELAQQAGCFAALLVERGIAPGERVLIWAENSAEWMAAFLGCMLQGVLAVPLDAAGSADFATRVAADTQARLAVGDAVLVNQLPASLPRLLFEDWPHCLPANEAPAISTLAHDTPLQILFTSGTTGEPKGVVLTHGNVLASIGPIEEGAQPYMRWKRLIHPLRILHTLPLSHVFGQTMGLWIPPLLAAEVHFESRLVAPRLMETIRRERISVLAAVPRVLAMLKAYIEAVHPELARALEEADELKPLARWWCFRTLHRAFGLKFWALVSGGGALAAPLEAFWNRLGFVLIQGYGMTETTALITLNHPFHVAQGSIGKPMPGREVKLGPDGEVLVRGASISSATWQGGKLLKRAGDWLATGDLATADQDGALHFVGRKSEVIVTSAGVNVHPEDLEAAVEAQPNVAACSVVTVQTANGPEPCAVVACRDEGNGAAAAIAAANAQLAEFQQIRRWVLWPEPDLPRTSTGKVRRKAVAEELVRMQQAAAAGKSASFGASSDWLLGLVAQITGETPRGVADNLRLTEDLLLDSLGRVQLAAAIEQRIGTVAAEGALERAQTLGELRALIAGHAPESLRLQVSASAAAELPAVQVEAAERGGYVYPTWPWMRPVCWLRVAFLEAVVRPLVALLAAPRCTTETSELQAQPPLLIVANHVSSFDVPLIQLALAAPLRRRMAVAMSAEMLDAYRHFRNPERGASGGFYLPGRCIYWLLTGLFNVFPLSRLRDFQISFSHAGKALDNGFNVLVFPEGTRSQSGELARFRPGIGLLAKQCGAQVLPVAIKGIREMRAEGRGWFRSGLVEVVVGEPIGFTTARNEAEITAHLEAEMRRLLGEEPSAEATRE